MPFLGWYNQSEVDGFVAYAVKEAVKQCNAANKSQVHIPSLQHYVTTIDSSVAMAKFDKVVDAGVNGSAKDYAFACSEVLKDIHSFYKAQYDDLVRRYNQLLALTDVVQEVRAVKALTAEVLVKLEEKEKTK